MSEKPEALRLANELDAYHTRSCHKEAAAELRRQFGEIESMRAERVHTERRLAKAEAQRDALLAALEEIHQSTMKNGIVFAKYVGINGVAAIAIRKAKEGK